MKIYDFKVRNAKGVEVPMTDYQGKVLLIVNTATGCGFTPQYEGLQNLYDKYKDKGFVVLDFPCNCCVFVKVFTDFSKFLLNVAAELLAHWIIF